MSLEGQLRWILRGLRRFLCIVIGFLSFSVEAVDHECHLLNLDDGEYLHQSWQSEDGLRAPIVRALLQCKEGYIWFRTDESIVRFDGIRMEELEIHTTGERGERWLADIIQTKDGSIWASSVNGGLIRIQGEAVRRYDTSEGLLTNYVLSIFEDSKSNLWIGTARGLNLFQNGRFVSYTNKPGLGSDAITAIAEDSEGNLLIGTSRGGLKVMKNDSIRSFTTENLLIHNGILCILEDREKRLWIGTSRGLTCVVDGKPMHYTTDEGLLHNKVKSIMQDRSGDIWIGTQEGLQKFRDGTFQTISVGESTSVDFDGIQFPFAIREDHEGNIWVANNRGLNKLRHQKIKTLTIHDGIAHNIVTSVLEDRNHNLWIGTYGGGLCRLSRGSIARFNTEKGLPSNHVLALAETSDGAIWVGFDSRGITRIKHGDFTHYRADDTNSVSLNTVRVIFKDSRGIIWIGNNAGLYQLQNGRFVDHPSFPNGVVKAIIEDRNCTLWVATTQGLASFKDGEWMIYRRENGLPSNFINTVFEDSDGNLWVTTEHGGIHQKTSRGFTASPPSLSQRILHIQESSFGRFWMTTRNGILSVSRTQLESYAKGQQSSVEVISYGKRDGMQRAQCNGIAQPAGYKSHDGRIWIPTMYGLVTFHPEHISSNDVPPPVVIQQILVDGKTIPVQSVINVAPGNGEIEFNYAALTFQAPERVRYQHMLEGFETNWVTAGERRTARYTNLRPGTYQFRVKASNNDGVWNEAGSVTTITLSPHIYQRPSFYAACILGMVLTGMGINAIRLRRLQTREVQLSYLVEKRTAKLQEALRSMERFNYSIAHDLRAPLRAVRGFTQAICEDYDETFDATGKEYCNRIEQSIERMDQLIDDLLTYGRLTHAEIHMEWIDSHSVLQKVLADFKPIIDEKAALLEVSSPLPKVWANETLLDQILSNLISNALKFVSRERTPQIRIWAEQKKTHTRIYVKDNGIGIAAEHQQRIFRVFERLHGNEAYPGTGIGLAIVEKAAERLEGHVGVISTTDQGSCFWIELSNPETAK
ncbi:MAG: two-component regulator propeller domain-containing protein [Limisphaerales bacterium]